MNSFLLILLLSGQPVMVDDFPTIDDCKKAAGQVWASRNIVQPLAFCVPLHFNEWE